MTALLEPGFLRELEALRRRIADPRALGRRRRARGEATGGSAEFLEHRPYTAGDDLRKNGLAGLRAHGEPVLKLFRAEEDVIVRLVVDVSASLDAGQPSKLDTARRVAAAVGYMALAAPSARRCWPPARG